MIPKASYKYCTNLFIRQFVHIIFIMSSLFKNRQIIKLQKVDSTNTHISHIASQLPEGSIVWALDQTQGRGQGSNKWNSEAGKNLMFSILFNPTFLSAYQQFYMSKVLALAVFDFISLHTDKVSIKWPNDIYAGDRKIGGILIEHVIEKTYLKQTIAGIGININQNKFPASLPNPVSLSQLSGISYNIEEMLEDLTDMIDYRYSILKDKDLSTIDKNFNEALFRYQHLAKYETEEGAFEGTITGVESTGELVIKDKSGKVRKFLHKEVEFVL